jgi:hypothetical protein
MSLRGRSFRLLLFPLLLVSAGCSVDATVGYNQTVLAGGVACRTDALASCEASTCAVSKLFDAPAGHVTLEADETEIFYSTSINTLARRPIAGGPAVELGATDTTVMGMTSDATHVYWIELGGTLHGVAKSGGVPFEASYVVGNPSELTVDATHLYWVFPGSGRVAMAPKPIGDATHISGQDVPRDITTDATHVYWVNAGSAAATGQLMRARRGDLTTAEVMLSGLDAPVSIAVNDDAIFWASKTAVFRLNKRETTAQSIATGFGEITRIGLHGSTLYGVGSDGLWRVPVLGGERMVLHPRSMSALAITCSGVFSVHWLEDGLERYGP